MPWRKIVCQSAERPLPSVIAARTLSQDAPVTCGSDTSMPPGRGAPLPKCVPQWRSARHLRHVCQIPGYDLKASVKMFMATDKEPTLPPSRHARSFKPCRKAVCQSACARSSGIKARTVTEAPRPGTSIAPGLGAPLPECVPSWLSARHLDNDAPVNPDPTRSVLLCQSAPP
ncbi:hypothetical protein M427DRAFT_71665 [Gonapodya prolifera JEL478]|uniref:Uncharacterized protein n=1 Tax=Gonapodya prolifera (strain JEL478) TaxID=1344416 RepID=A0A139A8U5_GONPJ|nr:hypothetical protein M427DRAFT_71665 [Gonapodya prolifera JEL478]|eukprot:KXS13108.1 hypothetical protein M427DRAFT_71665 [Gonapodya prolifera JEL478]